jgi:17beta-estradiol 17-dehydrogenase / very-long-chain 3-oxoacyl-CoA reductase
MTCGCFVTIAGYVALAILIKKLACSAYNIIFPYLFAVPQNLPVLAGAKWAVVTGSTDGIGKAYAVELAKKNFNVVLISRSTDKLKTVADEIRKKYDHIEVREISFDFTNANLQDYEAQIFCKIDDIEIGVLGGHNLFLQYFQ